MSFCFHFDTVDSVSFVVGTERFVSNYFIFFVSRDCLFRKYVSLLINRIKLKWNYWRGMTVRVTEYLLHTAVGTVSIHGVLNIYSHWKHIYSGNSTYYLLLFSENLLERNRPNI